MRSSLWRALLNLLKRPSFRNSADVCGSVGQRVSPEDRLEVVDVGLGVTGLRRPRVLLRASKCLQQEGVAISS